MFFRREGNKPVPVGVYPHVRHGPVRAEAVRQLIVPAPLRETPHEDLELVLRGPGRVRRELGSVGPRGHAAGSGLPSGDLIGHLECRLLLGRVAAAINRTGSNMELKIELEFTL